MILELVERLLLIHSHELVSYRVRMQTSPPDTKHRLCTSRFPLSVVHRTERQDDGVFVSSSQNFAR